MRQQFPDAHVTITTISLWERARATPTLDNALRLAILFRCYVEEIFALD